MDDMLDMHASFSRTSRYQIYSDLNCRFFNNTIPDTQQHLEMFEEKESQRWDWTVMTGMIAPAVRKMSSCRSSW